MNKLIQALQETGIAIRLKLPDRQSCKNCARSFVSATGDGWNEPRDYEWDCHHQERELKSLVAAYENVVGEVDYDFATVCPLYRQITEEELKAESTCD